MKLKITRERFNQIVQEEHQRIQEEKKHSLEEQDPLDDAEPLNPDTFDPDKILGNQPGLGFDIGSQQAFAELYARYSGGKDKAQIATDFEKIDALGDEKLSKMFKAFILRNTLLFPDETPGSVDLLRNDPEAVDAALAAIPDELEELEEDISDSLVKEIQNLLKQQGNL